MYDYGQADPYTDPWRSPPLDPGKPPLAGPGFRLLARIVDWLIVTGVYYALLIAAVLGWALMGGDMSERALDRALYSVATSFILYAVYTAVLFMYEWSFLALWGATPGKLMLRIRVRRAADDEPLGGGRAAARAVAYAGLNLITCVNLLDALWLLWDRPLQQCLHDKIAGTIVLRSKRIAHDDTPPDVGFYPYWTPTQTPGASSWT